MVGKRELGVVRMRHVQAHPRHRPVDLLGRPRWPRRSSSDPEVETVIGVDRTPPKVELERTEFVQVADSHSLIRRIVDAAEIDTVVDTRLVVDSIVTTPRRAHENNVIGTMNVLAACGGPDSPVRKLVFKSSAHYYGCEQDDPAFFTEDDAPPAPAAHAAREATSSRPSAPSRSSPTATRRRPSPCCASPTALGPAAARPRTTGSSICRRPDDPRLRPALPVHPRGRHRRLPRARGRATTSTASSTAPPTACSPSREVVDLLGKPICPLLPPWGTGLAARRAAPRRRAAAAPRCCSQLRFGRGLDNRRSRRPASATATRRARRSCKLREHQRLAPIMRGVRASATATSARSRSSCAAARASAPGGAPLRPRAR